MKKIKTILFILSSLANVCNVHSQENLISNPSFEEYYTCDFDITNSIIQDIIPDWYFKTNTSPRYLSTMCLADFTVTPPIFGEAYVASAVDVQDPDSSGFHDREYLQTRLKKSLEPSKDYYISYYITLPWELDNPLSHYGVHFTNEWWEGPRSFDGNAYPILLDPQVEVDTMPDMAFGKWTKIEHCFRVDSIVDVMVAGIFAHQAEILGTENQFGNYLFYGYDNFYLAEVEPDIRLDDYRDTLCAGECLTLSTNHSFIPGDFSWLLPGSDIMTSKDSTVTVCYDMPGVYDVSMEVAHCTGSYEGVFLGAVTVVNGIEHQALADAVICAGDSILVNMPPEYQITWNDGSNEKERSLNMSGTYQYILDNDVCQDTFTFDLSYYIEPIQQNIELQTCKDELATFIGVEYDAPGFYLDTLKSDEGCDSIFYEIQYTYYDNVTIPIDQNAGFCPGSDVTIDIPLAYSEVQWYDGLTSSSRSFDEEGVYVFEYKDMNMCKYKDSVAIIEYPKPIVMTTDLLDILYYEGLSLPVDYSIDATTFQWNNANGLDCTQCPYPSLIRPIEGRYIIEASNDYGCQETASIEVTFKEIKLYVPNVIKSNPNIRINGIFFVQSDLAFNYELYIFDRWGNQLFVNNNATSNNEQDGWNPKNQVNAGVFVYMIKYSENGDNKVLAGDVTVLE